MKKLNLYAYGMVELIHKRLIKLREWRLSFIWLFFLLNASIFVACTQNSVDILPDSKIGEIRAEAQSVFYGNQSNSKIISDKDAGTLVDDLSVNLDFVSRNNVYDLYEQKGINTKIIDALLEYVSDTTANFEQIVQKYKFNEKDIYTFAFSVEAYNCFLGMSAVETRVNKVFSCGLAVASSVATTLGAATITTGWGLGVFLVGKALSLASIAICAAD
jgi:hypothetical protein